MDTYWFDNLFDLLGVQTNSENEKLMVLYLDKELGKLKLPYHIDAVGNILVTKGKTNTYPCVVSHMDTVHNFVNNFNVYQDIDDKDILFAMNGKQKVGVGGDDKCGIFACLYLLKIIPQIKVVFFSREESGCKGSTGIDKEFFADCRYLIQLDRRGNKDFIQTYWGDKTISHEFSSEIGVIKKKYKYKNCTGTVTDVMKLWNNRVGVSCINLSCGYYNPHTNHEYISICDLWHSVKFTEKIINTMQSKRYISLPPKSTVTKVSYASSSYHNNFDQCAKCKAWRKEVLLYEVGSEKWCWSCKKERIDKEQTDESKKQNIDYSKLPNGDTILFICHECGKRTDEMEKGGSLKYVGGGNHLYCNKCASILFAASEEKPPEKCYVCDKIIPKDHQIIERFGVRVCEYCATQEELSC